MEKKKPPRSAPLALAILFLAFGLLYFVFIVLGYTLVPINRLAPAVMSTVITGVMVLLTVYGVRKKSEATRKSKIASTVMPICAMVFVFGKATGYDTDGIELYLLPVYGILSLICGLALFFAHAEEKRTRTMLGAIYAAACIPMFIALLFWDFGPDSVIDSEMSPNGIYLAEVVSLDQGTLGRSTVVRVTRQGMDKSIPIGMLRKDPKQVYKGEFGEHETMTISWETDQALYINGTRFAIQ